MAHCREGSLGYNYARCNSCQHREWYASSCGDRHCPNCLGARQAKWSQQVCERLPDCPHFHVVFSLPKETWAFFEKNYREAANLFFAAAGETLKIFQRNNWGCEGGFFSVLHTWGSALNWHPHLHCLVSGGGVDLKSGRWKKVRRNYLFPVKAMSKVFGAIFLRKLEELDAEQSIVWPEEVESLEARRDWRRKLVGASWIIHSKATLGNTRAVVRYLARYTSRIAMSNHRIKSVNEKKETVSFSWKDYRDDGRMKEREMPIKTFLYLFSRHLVPEGLRRIRYYGFLGGAKERLLKVLGAPVVGIAEKKLDEKEPVCQRCGAKDWTHEGLYLANQDARDLVLGRNRSSLSHPATVP